MKIYLKDLQVLGKEASSMHLTQSVSFLIYRVTLTVTFSTVLHCSQDKSITYNVVRTRAHSAEVKKSVLRIAFKQLNRHKRNSSLVVEQCTTSLHLKCDPVCVCVGGDFCRSSLHVLCGLGEGLQRCPPGSPVRGLWGGLQEYGVQGPLLQAIWSLYNRSKNCVCILSTKSNTLSVGAGLCQGCAGQRFRL